MGLVVTQSNQKVQETREGGGLGAGVQFGTGEGRKAMERGEARSRPGITVQNGKKIGGLSLEV